MTVGATACVGTTLAASAATVDGLSLAPCVDIIHLDGKRLYDERNDDVRGHDHANEVEDDEVGVAPTGRSRDFKRKLCYKHICQNLN